jgi:hypothetical protein
MNGTNKPSDLPLPADETKSKARQISLLAIGELVPALDNPRKHPREQVRAIARSITAFGFNAPILIDRNRQIVAGHGRYEAAKLLGLAQVPVVLRRGFGMDVDPAYIDTAIARWEKMTGQQARNANGLTFAQVKSQRSAGQ